jgi:hypothetical protein
MEVKQKKTRKIKNKKRVNIFFYFLNIIFDKNPIILIIFEKKHIILIILDNFLK